MFAAGLVVLFCTVVATMANQCLHYGTATARMSISLPNHVKAQKEKHYRIGKYLKACDHVYFISDYAIREEKLFQFCGDLKMEPLALLNTTEAMCLAAEFQKGSFGNSYFWLPARGKRGDFKWCQKPRNESSIRKDDFQFLEFGSQPAVDPSQMSQYPSQMSQFPAMSFYGPHTSNSIYCLKVKLSQNEKLTLLEDDCGRNFERFLCKIKAEDYPDIISGDDHSNLGQYAADIDKAKAVQDALDSMQSKNFLESDFVIHKACGKVYFINSLHVNWKLAMTECCKFGFKPLKLESVDEKNCLSKALADSEDFYPFWSGAYNSANGSDFTWLDGTPVISGLWASNQPGKPKDYKCAILNIEEWQTELTGLHDFNCKSELPVICQK